MSTPDPRDRALEHLLRTQAPASSVSPSPCPDANTLAAWLDGALTDEEVAAFEVHAATCARCSETMAVMIRSTEDAPALATAPAAEVLPRPGSSSTPHDSAPSRHMRVTRWLAPLTAAAAATLVWMLAPGENPAVMEQAPDSLQARAEFDAPAAPVPAEPTLPPGSATAPAQSVPSVTEPARPATKSEPPAAAPAPPLGAAPLATQQKVSPETSAAAGAGAVGDKVAEDLTARAATPPAQTVETFAAPLPAPAPAAEAPAAPAPAPAAETPAAPALDAARADASAVAGAMAARQRMASEAPARVITSSDTTVQWRFAGARAVERSVDNGATWTHMDTGATADLTAGAAPSANVCWVITADGQVLRTVDGTTWQTAARPATETLISVEAADERNASVTATSGRVYVTDDGGVTWRPRP